VRQCAAATGVKFWLGPSSALGEKVTSGLVWRFGTFECVSDNLACFKNGFGNSGSFLDVGSHRFYVAKPFPEEVTDVFDPLSDGGLSYSESSDLGAMVEVMALGEEEGGDSPRCARPPLERLPPQEKDAPDVAMVDLRTPLDHVIDPVQVAEALKRTRLVLVAMGPGQIQRSPKASQGHGGRGQGGRAPGYNAQGHRAQQAGGAGRPCKVPVPTLGLEPQVRQPALHIHLWLDHMKALPKGSASSKRAASNQGGSGAAGSGQGHKEGKYTLDTALD
jgi:hypothetical protein